MPEDIDERVDDRRGEDRAGPHPRVAVEDSGDCREEDVLPVGEGRVKDVREAENHGAHYEADPLIFCRSRKEVLKQSAKQKFLRPRRKEANSYNCDEQRARPEVHSRGSEMNEVDHFAQRNRDCRKNQEV